MSTVRARDFLKNPPMDIWDLRDRHDITHIEMDDGIFETSARKIILSRGSWLYQEDYPEIPLNSDQLITSNYFTPSSFNEILNVGYWRVFDHIGRPSYDLREDWLKRAMLRINELYNGIAIYCARYARGMCANDYIDIMVYPPILEIREKLLYSPRMTPAYYMKMIAKAKHIMLTDEGLSKNPVVIACRCRSMKIDQVLQLTISRGYGADVDARIFSESIRESFMDGVQDLASALMLSRDGATAKYYQGPPTQQSEYLNRRLRLLAMIYRHIGQQDCESEDYIENLIVDETMLRCYVGKYHLCPNENKLKAITMNDKHLIGKITNLRMIESCKYPDRYGVCWRCYGELSNSLARHDNIGWISASTTVEKVTQSILSKKHVILSAIVQLLSMLDETAVKYVKVGEDILEGNIYLKRQEDHAKYRYELVLSGEEARYIADLDHVKNINDVSLERVTKITMLLFRRINRLNEDDVTQDLARIAQSDSNAFLSSEMLKYIITNGYSIDQTGNYTVSLDEWDEDVPFIKFPPSLVNIPAYVSNLSRFLTNKGKLTDDEDEGDDDELRSQMDEEKRIKNFLAKGAGSIDESKDNVSKHATPMAGINAFMHLVLERLDINVVHLEILVFSLTVADAEERDYRPPLNRRGAKIMNFNTVMWYRSVPCALAFEKQAISIYNIKQSLVKHRAAHPFDELIVGVDN